MSREYGQKIYGGKAGANSFRTKMERLVGINCNIGSVSLFTAFDAYGAIKRAAFVSPDFPVANAEVSKYVGECGYAIG